MDKANKKLRQSVGGKHAVDSVVINAPPNSTQQCELSMYTIPPQEEITLNDMENLGYNRLQLLKQIEHLKLTTKQAGNVPLLNSNEFNQLLQTYDMYTHRNDNISHFIMRLAFCKTEELRTWYSSNETLLFKQRFDHSDEISINNVLNESGLQYISMIGSELDEDVRNKLQCMPAFTMSTQYFRMRFEDAWELLRNRQVCMIQGYAWISRQQLGRVLSTKFRVHLKHQLAQTHRAMLNLRQDKRVQPLINALSKQYVGSTYTSQRITGSITRDQLPLLADRSMPLCMSNLYKQGIADSHLKHGGRMQFGLFLKGIGLSMDESLAFWKLLFSRRVQGDKFDRQYAYNIRHNYGKEGKRTDYSPWSCMKIINESVGTGDNHGCPFKHFDEQNLRTKMRERKLSSVQCDEIIKLMSDKHYQVACKKYFTFTHNNFDTEQVGNHPNGYFDASMKYYAALDNLNVKQEVKQAITQEIKTESQPTNDNTKVADTEMKIE